MSLSHFRAKISIVTSTPLKLFPISKRLYLGPRLTQMDNFSQASGETQKVTFSSIKTILTSP